MMVDSLFHKTCFQIGRKFSHSSRFYFFIVQDKVYETIHHGPVVLCDEANGKVYAYRGCWDLDDPQYQQGLNIVREGYGMLKAGSIEEAITAMNETKCLPTGSMIFADGSGIMGDLHKYQLAYILKGPLADRRGTAVFEDYKYNSELWMNGFLDGWVDPETGKDNVFDRLYDYSEVPFDYSRENNGNPVDYFINCNSSANWNNLISGAPGGPLDIDWWLDNHGASLVFGNYEKLRQARVYAIIDELGSSFTVDETLIDRLLLDTCNNLGVMLIDDLQQVNDIYLNQLDPQDQVTVTTALNTLHIWQHGANSASCLDDASSSKNSEVMFLYKLWQANFMDYACHCDQDLCDEIYEIPGYRKSILEASADQPDPDGFCLQTLFALRDAYTEWTSYPDGWIYPEGSTPQPQGENERIWGKHYALCRTIEVAHSGHPAEMVPYYTEGDNKVLMTNNPLDSINWINQIRQGHSSTGCVAKAGNGSSAPMLAKLDPVNGITIFYSKAAASCVDCRRREEADKVAGTGYAFDVSCPATANWVNHMFERLDLPPDQQ